MLKFLANLLDGRKKDDGFTPAPTDQELMESVRARLSVLGGFDQPSGTEIRSIPGATVKFMSLAGMVLPQVFDQSGRPVGSIIPGSGEIVYVQARA